MLPPDIEKMIRYLLVKKRSVLVLMLCLAFGVLNAQYYTRGADPASTDWWQIKTGDFQIIFPAEYEAQAQVVARNMEYAYDYVAKTMNSKSRKLSVIIHTQSATSNGMVAWVPRRMELWTVPRQDASNYSQEWMEHLIIHEMRHFVQANKVNQGITKIFNVLIGEQAEMVPLGMKTRKWFMEGDAVVAETALSHSGRGRMPSFEQGLRALTLEKGKQSYDVAHLGSFKKHVPDHYEVGYHTVAVNRLYRDSAMFDDKMERIGRGFSGRGMRDNRKVKYYGFAIDYLEKQWRMQDEQLVKSPYESLTPDDSEYSSYRFLQEDGGRLYAVRTSLSKIPEVVELDTLGHEKVVAEFGYMPEYNFSVKNGLMVYTDKLPNARWEQSSSADLFVLDLETKKRRRLTKKQVLQAPSLSPDAKTIVAQWTDGMGAFALRLYDVESGRLLKQLPNPKNQFYFHPTWSDDGEHIIYVAQEYDMKCLKILDLESETEVLLVEGTYGEMSHPICDDDCAYFTASYSGINNIYRCDLETKEVVRMTSARFGADYAVSVDGALLYANYTSDGYRPVKHVDSDVAGESLSDVVDMSLGLGDMLTAQEGGVIDFSLAPEKKYETKNYSRFLHLLHFHSWIPIIPVEVTRQGVSDRAADDGELYPYLSLMSQNKLSTSFLTATYDGNPAKSHERYRINYTYEGFYPKLRLDATWGDYVHTDAGKVNLTVLKPEVSLPLVFKKGVYSYQFSNALFGAYSSHKLLEHEERYNYFSRGFSTYFSRARQGATRDLTSPHFQVLSFYTAYDDFDLYSDKNKYAFSGKLGFPGVGKHHSFQFGYHWQQKDVNMTNIISSLPRGYNSTVNDEISYFSLDYLFPLCYPDLHLGSLMNARRIKMGLYAEKASVYNGDDENIIAGAGGSLVFDLNFLRYEVDVQLGLQYGWAISGDTEGVYNPVNIIFKYYAF